MGGLAGKSCGGVKGQPLKREVKGKTSPRVSFEWKEGKCKKARPRGGQLSKQEGGKNRKKGCRCDRTIMVKRGTGRGGEGKGVTYQGSKG